MSTGIPAGGNNLGFTGSDGRTQRGLLKKEKGIWYYKKEGIDTFLKWCGKNGVQLRNAKITHSPDFARCLRATTHISPGHAIVLAPLATCFNFLMACRHELDSPHSFPILCTQHSWDKGVKEMPCAQVHQFFSAGWLARAHYNEDHFFHPYAAWLSQDSTGQSGISQAISCFREDDDVNLTIDDLFTKMAYDASVEVDQYMEIFLRLLSAYLGRNFPLDTEGVEQCMDGTGFFRSRAQHVVCPTLVPFIDSVPQIVSGNHNTIVQFISKDAKKELAEVGLGDTLTNSSYVVLRALREIEPGDYLTQRDWPKALVTEEWQGKVLEATRLNEYVPS